MTSGIPFSVLVVDDDPDDRAFINEAFMKIGAGTEAKKFIDGKALLRYLESIEPSLYPSLIVLDNTLPEMDAATLLPLLKGNAAYQKIPVVVVTSGVSPAKKEQLLSLGVYRCLQKGNTMGEIVELAKELKSIAENSTAAP